MVRTIMCFLLFSIFLCLWVSALEPPERIYSVEVGAYPSATEAQARKSEIANLGYQPLFVKQVDGGYKVWFGEFECFMDAYLWREDLRKQHCPDALIVKEENTKGRNNLEGGSGPREKVFTPPKYVPIEDTSPVDNEAWVKTVESLIENNKLDEAEQQLEGKNSQLNDLDPRKGWVVLKSAYVQLRKERKGEAALPLYWKVARGEVKATRRDLLRAQVAVGTVNHYYMRQRPRAYRICKELLEDNSDVEWLKTKCLVKLAALTMELARSAKGTLAECRRACQRVLEEVPESERQARATAELMFLETYYHEGDRERTVELGEQFLQKYPDRPRELSMCYVFLGVALEKVGRYEDARNRLIELLQKDLPNTPQETFATRGKVWNMKKRALHWLKVFVNHHNDQETINFCVEYEDAHFDPFYKKP